MRRGVEVTSEIGKKKDRKRDNFESVTAFLRT